MIRNRPSVSPSLYRLVQLSDNGIADFPGFYSGQHGVLVFDSKKVVGSSPSRDFSAWSLHALPVPEWGLSRSLGFLPQSKKHD